MLPLGHCSAPLSETSSLWPKSPNLVLSSHFLSGLETSLNTGDPSESWFSPRCLSGEHKSMVSLILRVSVFTALQSPIEYQRKEGGISMTRPLSSGRPPSAPPTPNGHAAQPSADSEQDDQVWILNLCKLFTLNDSRSLPHKPCDFDPPGAGAGAPGLRGSAGGRDLCLPRGKGSDFGVQPAGSESGLSAGQQRLARRRGLGGSERAQHALTHTQGQSLLYFTTHTDTQLKYCEVMGPKARGKALWWRNELTCWKSHVATRSRWVISDKFLQPLVIKAAQNKCLQCSWACWPFDLKV